MSIEEVSVVNVMNVTNGDIELVTVCVDEEKEENLEAELIDKVESSDKVEMIVVKEMEIITVKRQNDLETPERTELEM